MDKRYTFNEDPNNYDNADKLIAKINCNWRNYNKIKIERIPAITEPITSDIKSKSVSTRPC